MLLLSFKFNDSEAVDVYNEKSSNHLNCKIYTGHLVEDDNDMVIHDTVGALCPIFADSSCDLLNAFVNVEQIDIGKVICSEELKPLSVSLSHFADANDLVMREFVAILRPSSIDASNSYLDACINMEPIDTGQLNWTADFEPISTCVDLFADSDDPMLIDIVNSLRNPIVNKENSNLDVIPGDLEPDLGYTTGVDISLLVIHGYDLFHMNIHEWEGWNCVPHNYMVELSLVSSLATDRHCYRFIVAAELLYNPTFQALHICWQVAVMHHSSLGMRLLAARRPGNKYHLLHGDTHQICFLYSIFYFYLPTVLRNLNFPLL
ncbi:uncharacterized protein LOC113289754 isoform X1 [Papaver somniferum]|uniref:uncharacterized protein LOC113289754 isoform X1 n=1 Tax=Papaver somniferum TaxID=3469 RepID=UPI000E700B54|nr:uncharacterized protein LOC113289754 isoform X1 [Papaver somniferum]XP_026394907.1 uncharacterized protein LOC113289754 isoform X1 [Papaver somniferum]